MKNKTDLKIGLTSEQVEKRVKENKINKAEETYSKSYQKIIFDNLFTLFNFINLVLAVFIFFTGSYKNMLFLGVMFWNMVLGIVQEIRTKRTLDKISLIVNKDVCVIRDGKEEYIHPDQIVIDDLVKVKSGSQICCDGILVEGSLEVNESLLSGESDPVIKKCGDILYSGSYVIASSGVYQVTCVGMDSYASKMVKDAKKMERHPSKLRDSLNKIIKYIGIMIIPLGCILFLKHYFVMCEGWKESILSTSAALIGMIPEGLVILTSVALAVGVLHLTKYKTLVQELYCLETLARVDVLCLDKTGTLTEGKMQVEKVICEDEEEMKCVMQDLMASLAYENATSLALYETFSSSSKVANKVISFSSQRRYSGVIFEEESYFMGAYDAFFGKDTTYKKEVENWAKEGYRVLCVVKSKTNENFFNENVKLVGFVLLLDKVRESAKETLEYFKSQDVDVMILSGDDPLTVSRMAKKAGLKDYDKYLDVSSLSKEEIEKAVCEYKIFGRVSPTQKKWMIQALKKQGHCVGMSGDGVNDVLAFKEADISIAMASGSDIAKHSANLILLDSDFKAIPQVLFEGRRVINNIQKVATLFLTKTIFSIVLAFLTLLVDFPYPFEPVHLTFMSSFTIGIPSFFLALEPNFARVKDNFMENVMKISLPSAISAIVCIAYIYMSASYHHYSEEMISQLALIMICMNGFLVLLRCSFPYTFIRIALLIFSFGGMLLGLIFVPSLLSIPQIHWSTIFIQLLVFMCILISVSTIGNYMVRMFYSRKNNT